MVVECGFDVGCQVGQAITGIIAPYILPAIAVLVALFILPKAGKTGVALALIVIILVVLWYVGLPPLIPPLRGGFGY